MSSESDRDRLSQAKMLEWLSGDLPLTEMVTVYLSDDSGEHRHGIYCALVPNAQTRHCLERPTWDLHGRNPLERSRRPGI